MNNQQEKRGRGRPKGSTSFVKIRLGDLTGYLGLEASAVVSRKWLNEMGIDVEEKPKKVLTPVDDEPKIQFNVTE